METNRIVIALSRLLAVMLTTVICACQPPDTGDETAAPPTAMIKDKSAPSFTDLENATYTGILNTPVTLIDGEWQGEPFVAGGASRPSVGLIRDFRITGDLNEDGAEEAVALLWTNSGGSGTFDYIAIAGRSQTGLPRIIATAALGDRVKISAARIDNGRIVLDVVQAGPDDPACCPGQKFRRTFSLTGDTLKEVSSKDLGRLSIADLADVEWRLNAFDRDDVLPENIEITLRFDGIRIGGKSACNQYSGSVNEGRLPGAMTLDLPMISTMMACTPPADEFERRYLDALQGVTQYSFLDGNLLLTWRSDDRTGVMLFRPL